jgi:hypothetical protein
VTSEAGARGHSKINVRVRLWESRSTPTLVLKTLLWYLKYLLWYLKYQSANW